MMGHMKGLLGLLQFHPSVGHFELVRRFESSGAAMFHEVVFSLSNSLLVRPLVRFLSETISENPR